MRYAYRTQGVCSRGIEFELNNGVVTDVSFAGGCNGNLKAISRLVDGCKAETVVSLLKGNTCGAKPTSCGDQLAVALEQALAQEQSVQ